MKMKLVRVEWVLGDVGIARFGHPLRWREVEAYQTRAGNRRWRTPEPERGWRQSFYDGSRVVWSLPDEG